MTAACRRLLLLRYCAAKQEEDFLHCTKKKKKKKKKKTMVVLLLSPSFTPLRCAATLPSSLCYVAAQLHKSKCCLWSCVAPQHILWSCVAAQLHKQINKINETKKVRCLPWSRSGFRVGPAPAPAAPLLQARCSKLLLQAPLQAPLLQARSHLTSPEF